MDTVSKNFNRRDFLKIAGASSLALMLGSSAQDALAESTDNGGKTNFFFMAASDAAIIDGVHHRLLMGGTGKVGRHSVKGGGSFQHQDANPANPAPMPILGQGSWKAKRLVSFTQIGTHGIGVAGILNMEVRMKPVNGPKFTALLEIVCNIPPAGLFTGLAEGYTLTVAGAPFGPFAPLGPPPLGITWFTNLDIDDE